MRSFFKKLMNEETLPKILMILSFCILSFWYGYLALAFGWFPHSLIREGMKYLNEKIIAPEEPWYYADTNYTETVPVYDVDAAANGLSLVTGIIEDRKISARIIDMDGRVVHAWNIDWFDLWPEPTHLQKTAPDIPKSRPGTHIHGALLLENGDLIFNFTNLGMMRLDICGNVVWRLPYRTHHSIYLDENGYLWVPGMIKHTEAVSDLPNHIPPFTEFTILKVSLDGAVVNEISVFDLLSENDLLGLLNLSTTENQVPTVSGDTLHLNDVETFPSTMEEGIFTTGDVLISLRNINTILVFREEDLSVKYVKTGVFVRQHDPDFIDGNTISVFDNFNIGPEEYGQQSRIVILSTAEDQHSVYFSGNEEIPFYSSVMGNHQWQENGNLLITESNRGRAFEINQDGQVVWEYINLVGNGYTGIVEDVQRLPDIFTADYIGERAEKCNLR